MAARRLPIYCLTVLRSAGTTGYTFTWLQSDGVTAIPGSGNAATIGTSLGMGGYFVSATNTTTNCTSPTTPFAIKDVHVDPSIAGTVVDNTNCAGVMQNGTITISIDGGAVPDQLYDRTGLRATVR